MQNSKIAYLRTTLMITFEGPQCMWTNPSKKIQAWVRPRLPSRQCLYFGNFWSGIPSLNGKLDHNLSMEPDVCCKCNEQTATKSGSTSANHFSTLTILPKFLHLFGLNGNERRPKAFNILKTAIIHGKSVQKE